MKINKVAIYGVIVLFLIAIIIFSIIYYKQQNMNNVQKEKPIAKTCEKIDGYTDCPEVPVAIRGDKMLIENDNGVYNSYKIGEYNENAVNSLKAMYYGANLEKQESLVHSLNILTNKPIVRFSNDTFMNIYKSMNNVELQDICIDKTECTKKDFEQAVKTAGYDKDGSIIL
jgi:hypothetical protein